MAENVRHNASRNPRHPFSQRYATIRSNNNRDLEERHLTVVSDDLMSEVVNSKDISIFFTISCHHSSCSMIFVTHNLYQSK